MGKVVFVKKNLIPPANNSFSILQDAISRMTDDELSQRWEVLANQLIAWKFPDTKEWHELNMVNKEIKTRIFKDYPL